MKKENHPPHGQRKKREEEIVFICFQSPLECMTPVIKHPLTSGHLSDIHDTTYCQTS